MPRTLPTILDVAAHLLALAKEHGNLPVYIFHEDRTGRRLSEWEHPAEGCIAFWAHSGLMDHPFIGIM